MTAWERWRLRWIPPTRPHRRSEVVRATLGGLIGIALAALAGRAIPGGPAALPYVVAPIGASAVLVFAAPASPLAQPYNVIVGNFISSLIGVTIGRLTDRPELAAAVAVSLAILAMMLLRCVHPPGGACALFSAVAPAAVVEHGYLFALWPVAVNSIVLVAAAVVVNSRTGRPYPHVPDVPAAATAAGEPPPLERVGVSREDVDAALARNDTGLDIMPGDVVRLVREAEDAAIDRRLGHLRCGDIMSRDIVTLSAFESLYRARLLINHERVKGMPVVDADRHVVGIVTIADLFNRDVTELSPVSSVMSTDVTTVGVDTPMHELVELMADAGLRHLPVVDADGRLEGLITRSELIAVMHRALLGGT